MGSSTVQGRQIVVHNNRNAETVNPHLSAVSELYGSP